MSRLAHQCLIAWKELPAQEQTKLSQQLEKHILHEQDFPEFATNQVFLAALYYCYQSPFEQQIQSNWSHREKHKALPSHFLHASRNTQLDMWGKRFRQLFAYQHQQQSKPTNPIEQLQWWIPNHLIWKPSFKTPEGTPFTRLCNILKRVKEQEDAMQFAMLVGEFSQQDILDWVAMLLHPTLLQAYLSTSDTAISTTWWAAQLRLIWEISQQQEIIPADCLALVAQLAIRLAGMAPEQKTVLEPLLDAGIRLTTRIQGGEYIQGLPKHLGYGSQCPERTVLIPWDLEVSLYPLTRRLLQQLGFEPSSTFSIDDLCPADSLSLQEAIHICNKRSEFEGKQPAVTFDSSYTWHRDADGWRLPTEAEWEVLADGMACGAADYEPLASAVAHYSCSSPMPVGGLLPNGHGIYDLCGNIWEMLYGKYDVHSYENQPYLPDPLDNTGDKFTMRGGSWSEPASWMKTHLRMPTDSYASPFIGLRMVRRSNLKR